MEERNMNRFSRNEALFGALGQQKLRGTYVAIVGVGGIGTHIVQQLALLGVGGLALIDHESIEMSNLNRYIGVGPHAVGCSKVDAATTLAHSIDPKLPIDAVEGPVWTAAAVKLISRATHVFGCVDSDGARCVLNEITSAFAIPFIDCASDVSVSSDLAYGGRVFVNWTGDGCLVCMGLVDPAQAAKELEGTASRVDRNRIYGIASTDLDQFGPSVVSINGVVASLAATEFMVGVTGLRPPIRLIQYYGHRARTTVNQDEPERDCFYCRGIRGRPEAAAIERLAAISSG
jgi:hypothetical protein